ncbi:acyl-CoA dehydrogenase [Candidatus Bathyarchaeota archaeon]|nr:MAG: acyl-CoA dehydrogenase [Candidatus Bathyarchaeota archaeon]
MAKKLGFSFELTEEQEDIKRAVREFCEKEFDPELALELDRREEFPMELYKKAAKLGFTSMRFPEEYGGQGYGILEDCLVVEEMCRADSSLGIAITAATFASDLIMIHGTEEQKERYLPPICRGDFISSGAFTEPARGSDLASRLDTRATRYGDTWYINGVKTFITNAPVANFFVVLCQTDPKAHPPHRGQSLFVVDRDVEGLEVSKLKDKMGIRPSLTGEVAFSDVKVPADALLGELNKGFYYAIDFFDKSRVGVAAQAVGIAQGAFEIAYKYAKEREAFGRPIIQFEGVSFKLVDAATLIEAARLLTYKAAWLIDQGRPDPLIASMAKTFASEIAVRITEWCIGILGGYGYFGDYRVERYHRDAIVTTIYEGTNEIQRLTTLRYLLRRL